jgi:hypothetical protein
MTNGVTDTLRAYRDQIEAMVKRLEENAGPVELEAANILNAFVYAVDTGRVAHMEAHARVMCDAWMIQEERKKR